MKQVWFETLLTIYIRTCSAQKSFLNSVKRSRIRKQFAVPDTNLTTPPYICIIISAHDKSYSPIFKINNCQHQDINNNF